MTWRVYRQKAKIAHFRHIAVGDRQVVRGKHLRVIDTDAHVDSCVAHRDHCLDVIPVPVSGEYTTNSGGTSDFEQQLMLVCRIQQHGISGLLASDYVDIVLYGADNELVDQHIGVVVMGWVCHVKERTGAGLVARPSAPVPAHQAPSTQR